MRLRPRGFPAGLLAGLCWIGVLWFWIVDFRFGYEIVVVTDRTIGFVTAEYEFDFPLFPTSLTEIRRQSGPDGRVLLLGGVRSLVPFKTVTLRVQPLGTRDIRYVTVDLKAPAFARHCTAVVAVGVAGTEVGPCMPSETAWIRW